MANTTSEAPTNVVEVRGDGTTARIVRSGNDVVRLSFSVRCGPAPLGRRERLVEAVFAQPELDGARMVQATLPLGDVDLLRSVERHLDAPTTRAAGSSCLLDGALPSETTPR